MTNNTVQSEILTRFSKRKKIESRAFSVRSLASTLGISPSLTSMILNGQRRLPLKLVDKTCAVLDIGREDRDRLVESLLNDRGVGSPEEASNLLASPESAPRPKVEWQAVPKRDFDLFASWYPIAILECTLLDDYDGTIEYLARKLNLDSHLVLSICDQLKTEGFLTLQGGMWRKNHPYIEIKSASNYSSIRQFHIGQLENAAKILRQRTSEQDLKQRCITGATMTGTQAKISALRHKIQELIRTSAEEMASGPSDGVYHLAVQLFPLTENSEEMSSLI